MRVLRRSIASFPQHGFSLVELSIVLVILGLLTGGILAGQSLIRAAELRSVSTEYDRYVSANHVFRDKYFAFPGDFNNATAFWGKDNTYCSGNTGTVAIPGTCNGNADSTIASAPAANQSGEMFRYWQHLAFAGLIEGNYSGLAGSISNVDSINTPRSKMPNAAWGMQTLGNFSGDGSVYDGSYGSVFHFGSYMSANSGWNLGAVLKPEDAWNIDTKTDDGLPGIGKIIARYPGGCGSGSNVTPTTATYRTTDTTLRCAFYMKTGY